MAARFDFVPTSRNKTRCLGLAMSCTRSDGGSPTFNRRMSTLPSFLISPKAAPRRLDNGREASPVAAVIFFKLRDPFFPEKKKHRPDSALLFVNISPLRQNKAAPPKKNAQPPLFKIT